MSKLDEVLARARTRAHYSQDDVGAALGINRVMVSYWEAGTRTPNDRQLSALARLYGIEPADLVEGRHLESAPNDLAGMLLRAEDDVDPGAVPGIRDFVHFLDRFAELARILGEPIRGLTQSPFVFRQKFTQKDDIRRKAEEVRAYLGLGSGPISDLDPVCETLGVAVYRAPLGSDLSRAPSGAFLSHPEVGYAILVNLDMTPGRRRFTVAHELAHALFHSNETNSVLSHGRGQRGELRRRIRWRIPDAERGHSTLRRGGRAASPHRRSNRHRSHAAVLQGLLADRAGAVAPDECNST